MNPSNPVLLWSSALVDTSKEPEIGALLYVPRTIGRLIVMLMVISVNYGVLKAPRILW